MLACDPGLHIPREPERRRLGVQFTCDDQQFGFPGNQTPVYIDDSGVKLSTSVLDRNTNGVRCFDAYYEPSRVTMTDNQARTPMGFIGSLKITRSIAAGNAAGVVSSALTRCRGHRQLAAGATGPTTETRSAATTSESHPSMPMKPPTSAEPSRRTWRSATATGSISSARATN